MEGISKDKEMHLFISYLVYWVAGTKLIFSIFLLIILCLGTPLIKIVTMIGLILSISSFYWKLYPIIKQLDSQNKITPKGYSRTLNFMILGFIGMFAFALIYSIIHITI